ncbi:unnamed protein product, partial [Ectocarpus sp. 12 AP-2014]
GREERQEVEPCLALAATRGSADAPCRGLRGRGSALLLVGDVAVASVVIDSSFFFRGDLAGGWGGGCGCGVAEAAAAAADAPIASGSAGVVGDRGETCRGGGAGGRRCCCPPC